MTYNWISILLFIIFLILILSNNNCKNKSDYKSKNKIAIALLTVKPNNIWLKFLLTFINNYDVYIFIDDNNIDLTDYKNNFPELNFIQINNNECFINGYSNSSYIIKTDPISWDKALYYFSVVNKNYDNVWFTEDDVYIDSVNNLLYLDNKFNNSDLIVKSNIINNNGKINDWHHWSQVEDTLKLPWSMSMVCICRLSKELLKNINNYTKKFKKLNFIEFLFNTIALHNNLIISNPIEFEPILYRNNWDINKINRNYFYHPLKNINDHEYIRSNNK